MANPELVEWVNKYLAAGYDAEQLYSYLLQQGYSESDVRGALDSALGGQTQNQVTPQQIFTQNTQQNAQQNNFQSNVQTQNSARSSRSDSFRDETSRKKKKILIIIIIVVVVLLLLAGGYLGYVKYMESKGVYVAFNPFAGFSGQDGGDGIGPGDVIMPYGGYNESNENLAPVECFDQGCFEENFANCAPSFFLMVLQPEMSQHYEILGKEGTYCKVLSYYENHPSPDWVGPEMTCFFDNTIQFQEASNDITRCDGPLFELIMGQ